MRFTVALCVLATCSVLSAQQFPNQVRQADATPANAQADQIRHAEDLLERGDYAGAEVELTRLAAANAGDARVQYDLGFTQERNGKDDAAAKSYLAAIAADGKLAEAHVALGLLRARDGDNAQARSELEFAVKLPGAAPALKARALRALARLDEGSDRDKSRQELFQAVQLTGEQPGDSELTASLAAQSGDPGTAEAAYRRTLDQQPGEVNATVGLVAILQQQSKLAEADSLLGPALSAHANDPRLVAQAASLYAQEGKSAEAVNLLRGLRASDPGAAGQPALTRLMAHLELVAGDPANAETLYMQLVTADPDDPRLLDDLGSALVREQKYAQAQGVLSKAVAMRGAFHDDAAWGEAAGHLAFAASKNQQPQVALQALQARGTVLPNSPASLFLEATAHDSLHQRKEAERTYRAFLALAGGKLPDEEFQARHRLIALEHEH